MSQSRKPSHAAAPAGPVTVRPLTCGDGALVERLFGAKGACGGCWCMFWRRERHGRLWNEVKGARNRSDFLSLVAAGGVHAMLALSGGEPVGWCCFGPFETFPKLVRVKPLMRARPDRVWAIVCLYLARAARRQGIGARLIDAAAREALSLGAALVEGYPVRPKGQGDVPDVFAFTGVPRQFEAAGFARLKRPDLRDIYVKPAS
jgi:GNAT superfamily N-acetyltransferase